MEKTFSDEYFMKIALSQAKIAFDEGEIPIGCVIVNDNKIIAKAYNRTEALNDVTAHAEMQAITMAAETLGGKYLDKCTIYVTVEPCIMCAGALFWAKANKIVYGAGDNRNGFTSFNPCPLHPKGEYKSGVLAEECSQLMKCFFKNKRL